MIQNAEAMEED